MGGGELNTWLGCTLVIANLLLKVYVLLIKNTILIIFKKLRFYFSQNGLRLGTQISKTIKCNFNLSGNLRIACLIFTTKLFFDIA